MQRKPFLIAIFTSGLVFLSTLCFSQNLDLIVTSDGDSIACRIDSITDTHIYYEMKVQGAWIHTHISKADVLEFEQGVVQKKHFQFKPGTSIIESLQATSIDDLPRNSIYVGILTLNYSRLIPIGQVGLTFGAGLMYIDDLGVLVESTVLFGNGRHNFEPGIMGFYFIVADLTEVEESDSSGDLGASIRLSYRYQSPQGIFLRTGINVIFLDGELGLLPALSFGFSF